MAVGIEKALVDSDLGSDVYAFSLWVSYRDDDPRLPEVRFGSNTEAQVARSVEHASGPVEARWNFAFWQQDELCSFGTDSYSSVFLTAWLQHDCGLWFTDADEANDCEAAYRIGGEMQFAFFRKMIDVVREVQDRGTLRSAVGHDVPLVIHELEYHDEIALVNERANGAALLPEEFFDFCRGAEEPG